MLFPFHNHDRVIHAHCWPYLIQERKRESKKKVNETEKTGNISMDDDEQQNFQLCLVGGLGGISFSLSLCKKQNAYSSFNALQNQPFMP